MTRRRPGFFKSAFDPNRGEGWFQTKYPPAVDVLVFNVAEGIRDVDRLKGLYDVFAQTLHQLSEMGIAGKGTGGVKI
ncbi:hypothetical protein D3C83_155180 [compost metagenome]